MSEEGSCREKEQICSSRKEGIDKSENKVYFKFHFETELWQKVRSFTLERYSRLKMMGYRRRGIEGLRWIKGERGHKTERKSRGLRICESPGECSTAPHAVSQRPDPPVGTVNVQLFLVSFTLFGSFPLMCMAQICIFGWWKSTHNPVWGRGTHEWQANNNNKWTKQLTPNSTSVRNKSNHAPRSSPYSYTAQDVGMTKICVWHPRMRMGCEDCFRQRTLKKVVTGVLSCKGIPSTATTRAQMDEIKRTFAPGELIIVADNPLRNSWLVRHVVTALPGLKGLVCMFWLNHHSKT